MRTIPFRDVWNGVVGLHGRDPRKNVSEDLRDAAVNHINDRVRTIWQGWRWPEWDRTEERAFRTVWNDERQFLRVGADGNPDEVYYIPNQTYYRVNADAVTDPPIGTVPTDGSFFGVLDPVETFIEFDQACKRSIGIMQGVFKMNPRNPTCSASGLLRYMPSERGIDVCCPGVPTVWINYKRPVPRYTMVPYVAGKTYVRGNVVFDPTTGECFQAVIETTAVPTNTAFWNWVPFLDVWSDYVAKGAFADSLLEFDQGGNTEIQAKMVLNQYWEEQAKDSLQGEVDTLTFQGQKLQWNFCGFSNGWYKSMPWCGGAIVELTAITGTPFASIVTDEIPAGAINGLNTVFVTAYQFSTLWVFLNGLKQQKDVDYTLNNHSGFTMTSPPAGGDTLTVDYIRL